MSVNVRADKKDRKLRSKQRGECCSVFFWVREDFFCFQSFSLKKTWKQKKLSICSSMQKTAIRTGKPGRSITPVSKQLQWCACSEVFLNTMNKKSGRVFSVSSLFQHRHTDTERICVCMLNKTGNKKTLPGFFKKTAIHRKHHRCRHYPRSPQLQCCAWKCRTLWTKMAVFFRRPPYT